MQQRLFPVIDLMATGRNIRRLREERGMTVRDLQAWFNFEEPRAIYKWQSGQSLPTVDNLYALSALLGVTMEDILVSVSISNPTSFYGSQDSPCDPVFYFSAPWDAAAHESHFPRFFGNITLPGKSFASAGNVSDY